MVQTAGIPPYSDLLWPTLIAVQSLGGVGKLEEIDDAVVEGADFSEEQLAVLHKDGPRSELEYRLAWARTYLRGMGILDNPSRGTWKVTDFGNQVAESEIEPLRHAYLKKLAEDRRKKGRRRTMLAPTPSLPKSRAMRRPMTGVKNCSEFCSIWTPRLSSTSLAAF